MAFTDQKRILKFEGREKAFTGQEITLEKIKIEGREMAFTGQEKKLGKIKIEKSKNSFYRSRNNT